MDYVELTLSKLLFNVRGHESARFTLTSPFAAHPNPNLSVSSPQIGPSGSTMPIDYTQDGRDLFPSLEWSPSDPGSTTTSALSSVQEYLLVVQDVDAPLPWPALHGVFHGLPPEKTSVADGDFDPVEEEGGEGAPPGTRRSPTGTLLKGGFRRGKNLRGWVYGGPRALKGHGPHRYYFMVVALGERLDGKGMSAVVTLKELERAIEGKVVGWGEWVGVSERKWGSSV